MSRYKVNITGKIRQGKHRRLDSIPDYNVGDILDIYVSGIKNSTWIVVKSDRRPVCAECPMFKTVIRPGELCPCYVLCANIPLCGKASARAWDLMKFVEVANVLEDL